MKTKAVTSLLILSLAICGEAQERIVGHNNDLWFFNVSSIELKKGLGIESEIHWRIANWTKSSQFLFRPSIWYDLNKKVKFHLGYVHIESYPYGDQPLVLRTPENSFWGQATINHTLGSFNISHRYRIEERWIRKISDSTTRYRPIAGVTHKNRFRYRLTLKKKVIDNVNVNVFNEMWINFGENTGLNRFDQNWLYIGIGLPIRGPFSFEIGYLNQWIAKVDGIHFESNNTIQITTKLNISKS